MAKLDCLVILVELDLRREYSILDDTNIKFTHQKSVDIIVIMVFSLRKENN